MNKSTRILNFLTRVFLPPILFIFLSSKATNTLGPEGVIILPLAWVSLTQILKYTIFPSKAVYEKKIIRELENKETDDMVAAYRKRKKNG